MGVLKATDVPSRERGVNLNTLYGKARAENNRLLCKERGGAVCFNRNRPPGYIKGTGKCAGNYGPRYSIFKKAQQHLQGQVWEHTGSLGRMLGDGKTRALFELLFVNF